MLISINEEQSQKAPFSIKVREEGLSNVIFFKDEHLEKEASLIIVTVGGIVISLSLLQLLNMLKSIFPFFCDSISLTISC